MREFNYEEAKAGKKVCTRDGKSVRIIDWGSVSDDYPILAKIIDREWESREYFTIEGKFYELYYGHPWDLMMEE